MFLMLFLASLFAWIGGVVVSLYSGNRTLPLVVLLVGIGLLIAPIGMWKLAGLAVLGVTIWIANKADMA